jgi:peptide/nickel transport system permease protein
LRASDPGATLASGVIGYIVRRIGWAFALLLLATFFTFVIFFVLPAEETRVGRGSGALELAMREAYNLGGDPLPKEYWQFLVNTFGHGTLGDSFVTREPVLDMLARTLPVTASLLIGGFLICMAIALPVGILSALRARSLVDRAAMVFVLIGISAHPVWIALVLSYLVGVKAHVLPIGGYCDFVNPSTSCGGAVEWAQHLILPWLSFAFLFAALYTRMIRASVLEALDEDYVRTARAKGASRERVIRAHVLRNALLPVATMIGMDAALAFGGAIFIESVYGLPGMGRLTLFSLARRDLPVIMGVVLVVTAAIVFFNTVIDILYGWLDPRIQVVGGRSSPEKFASLRGRTAMTGTS